MRSQKAMQKVDEVIEALAAQIKEDISKGLNDTCTERIRVLTELVSARNLSKTTDINDANYCIGGGAPGPKRLIPVPCPYEKKSW